MKQDGEILARWSDYKAENAGRYVNTSVEVVTAKKTYRPGEPILTDELEPMQMRELCRRPGMFRYWTN